MSRGYELKISADDNGTLLVTAPAFPEVSTYGDDVQEAQMNGRAAIEEAIAARAAVNERVPQPTEITGGWSWSVELTLDQVEDIQHREG